jgi:2-oxo-3-hexenedioate decarboxylase
MADGVAAIADSILSASDGGSSIAPITAGLASFDLAAAYRVAALVAERRIERGERPLGWKIGFTNRTIWDEYGVHAPIWGPMYDSTVAAAGPEVPLEVAIGALVEPRIEPEIAFRLTATPHPSMEERELLSCIGGVAHGFEIVQSIFPGWRFKASDTVAAFALHGCYRHGPFVAVDAAERPRWLDMLRDFEIALYRDGAEIDRGRAENVLGGGPLAALRAFVRGLAEEHSPAWILRPGEIVTTGTVTRAFPVAAGERWSTGIAGLPLPGMDILLV